MSPPHDLPSPTAARAARRWLGLGPTRSALALAIGIGSVVILAATVERTYPMRNWLAAKMAVILGWEVLLNLAWAGVGLRVSHYLYRAAIAPLERLVVGVATGVVCFAFSLYLLGVVGMLRPAAAVGLILAFLLVGLPGLRRWLADLQASSPPPAPRNFWDRALPALATGAGILAVGIIYLGILHPDTINYDARWWHLSISEGYARTGRLIRFPGNWVNSYPHLASVLHTWDFLVPGITEQATRQMMVLHTEFSLFVWTLVGVGAAVRFLTRDAHLRGTWAGFFLFPGIFVYDGNMGGSSDHVMASFVIPLFLVTARLHTVPGKGAWVLWGALVGGILMTKVQAVYVLVPMTAVVIWKALRTGPTWRLGVRHLLTHGAIALGAFLVVSAPHFGTNIGYHSNPFYPLFQDWFPRSHPTVPNAPTLVREILMDWSWKPQGTLPVRLKEALELLFTFAFRPHYSFTNGVPVFGFAFTLTLPFLLTIPFREARRLWLATFLSLGALFCWANTVRVDRNLQTFLPLLVVTTVAILVRAWRTGLLARIGVAVLVISQLTWAGDTWFGGGIGSGIALIRSGADGHAETRFAGVSADYVALNRVLPKEAVVLLHHWHLSLGINRPIFTDWVGFQGSIDYHAFSNERQYYDRLRQLGITHVVHIPGEQASPSRQEDVIFNSLTLRYGGAKQRAGMFEYYELPRTPPPPRPPLKVLTIGTAQFADGQYEVTDLGNLFTLPPRLQHFPPPRIPAAQRGYAALADVSDAVLVGPNPPADPVLNDRLAQGFQRAAPYPGLTVYIRNP